MKIIAVGMNYPQHCRELHASEPLPEEPVIFMKPTWWYALTVWEKILPNVLPIAITMR